jgi:hypothetical protein
MIIGDDALGDGLLLDFSDRRARPSVQHENLTPFSDLDQGAGIVPLWPSDVVQRRLRWNFVVPEVMMVHSLETPTDAPVATSSATIDDE